MPRKQKPFKIAAVYDTETTTVKNGDICEAFAYSYIFNHIADINLYDYTSERDDDIEIIRSEDEAFEYINALIVESRGDYVPVVAAYNLMFDLQTLLEKLASTYQCTVTAQTATHVYVFDLKLEGQLVLRFWDTFFLDMCGLKSMGATAGLPKAVGDLDYSLIRTGLTPTTATENFYMRRDVQVIPAYLKFLLHSYAWLEPDMFAVRVMTKTSLVRQMAAHEIANLRPKNSKHKLGFLFECVCKQELPPDFQTMMLRTACFRGGFTFTAARTAMKPVKRVTSLDVTSMHHMYINGRRVPVHFCKAENMSFFRDICTGIMNRSVDYVLQHYYYPFSFAIHGMFIFKNLRLKENSAFSYYGIATLAEGKFTDKRIVSDDDPYEANAEVDNVARARGWFDAAQGAEFAFGKLYSAETAQLCLSEVELWNLCQVYDFDAWEPVAGEYTCQSITPPDYVSLQSNILFEQKSHVKHITKTYTPGTPYAEEIPNDIPESIADQLRAGTVSKEFLNGYYNVATKGAFNGIYGTQAMQLWRPDFCVTAEGEIVIDKKTVPTEENFDDDTPDHPRVLYTYGLRIVAGSRQHLVIAIKLIYDRFGSKALITGGDTDSLKISLAPDVEANDLIEALAPLHNACIDSMNSTQKHLRENFPALASPLTDIGVFDIEPASKEKLYYDWHIELWNKARISFVNGHSHVTMAGISRPERPDGYEGCYHIEHVLDALVEKGYSYENAVNFTLGYNASLAPSVAHTLMRDKPKPADRFQHEVTDYFGNKTFVDCHRAQALWPIWKTIGDTMKFSNEASVRYLQRHYHRKVDKRDKYVSIIERDGTHVPHIEIGNIDPVIIE